MEIKTPLQPDKLKQIFSILLHRDNGTYSHTYRTTQLHPVGEVRSLMRERVPSTSPGIRPSARDGPLGRFNQNTAAQRCNGGSIYCNVRKISEHAIK